MVLMMKKVTGKEPAFILGHHKVGKKKSAEESLKF